MQTDKMQRQIGAWGEETAAEYLEKKGFKILDRNFRVKAGEIDIIAADGGCVVFAEVKTRKNSNFGRPSEYVDYRKQKRIKTAALCYAGSIDTDMRFDVIEVFYRERGGFFELYEINHIENAF